MPSVQVIKENQRKNTGFLGILMHYFPYSSGTSLTPVRLCASECLCSALFKVRVAIRWEIGVHRCGTPLLQLTPCLQLCFFSLILFPLPLPLVDVAYLCSDIRRTELLLSAT